MEDNSHIDSQQRRWIEILQSIGNPRNIWNSNLVTQSSSSSSTISYSPQGVTSLAHLIAAPAATEEPDTMTPALPGEVCADIYLDQNDYLRHFQQHDGRLTGFNAGSQFKHDYYVQNVGPQRWSGCDSNQYPQTRSLGVSAENFAIPFPQTYHSKNSQQSFSQPASAWIGHENYSVSQAPNLILKAHHGFDNGIISPGVGSIQQAASTMRNRLELPVSEPLMRESDYPYYKQNVLSGNVPGFDDLVLPSTRLAEEAKEAFESAMPAEFKAKENWESSEDSESRKSPNLQGIPRMRWTKNEDMRLRNLVNEMGSGKWTAVAKALGRRSAKQCRERYNSQLQPNLIRGKMTPEEESQLLTLFRAHGRQWSKIAKLMSRSENDIKNCFFQRLQKRIPEISDSRQSRAYPHSSVSKYTSGEPC